MVRNFRSIHSSLIHTGMDVAGRLAIVSPFVLSALHVHALHTQVYVHIWIWTLDNQWFRPFPLVVKLSLSHHRGPGDAVQYIPSCIVVWSTVLT